MAEPVKASLLGAYARTARAQEHIFDLMARSVALRDEQEKSCSLEWDTDPNHFGEPKLVVNRWVKIPVEIGVIIGEAVYNLRSALDYLVYELATLDTGTRVDGTQFPIEDKPKGFKFRKERGWLNGLNAAHVAAIEGLQPYRGIDWTAALRDLSNPDKHRELTFHGGRFQASVFANAGRLRFLNLSSGPITRAKHPVSGKEVEMQFDLTFEILLADGTPVVETLRKLQSRAIETLEAFKPEFK